MSDASVVCSNLSFSWSDGTRVFENLSVVFDAGRTGVVAPNGAGKTTLLKLIAGHYRPSTGSVSVRGELGYLPQHLPFSTELTVAEVLGVAPVLRALAALDAGTASDEVFTVIGEDWDIAERVAGQLDRLGLGHIGLGRQLASVSGGEVVALGLAAQLLRRPDVLLLDEPSNNLDLDSRYRLYSALDDYRGCLVVASHDRALLERMDRIVEICDDEIRCYGGNYSVYQEVVQRAAETAEQNLRNATMDLKREQQNRQKARERAARRSGNAVRQRQNLGLPKALLDKRKSSAQESAAKSDQIHAARVEVASARVDEANRALRQPPTIAIDLPETEVPAGRTVFCGEQIQVRLNGRPLFAGNGVDLSIRGPERIALTGANGAGKSTLLRVIGGHIQPAGAHLTRGPTAYLAQRLDTLAEDRTVAENLAAFAPGLSETLRMTRLARFQFAGARAHQPVATLSGGERMRATLACLLSAEPPPQLLLLDEPTNNLDLDSVAQLQSALTGYRGALVIVSHDHRFLRELNIDRWLHLAAGELRQISAEFSGVGAQQPS